MSDQDLHAGEMPESPEVAAARSQKRKKLFTMLGVTVAVLGGSWYAYDNLVASKHVTTDNAYVGAHVAQVTPLVGGPVLEVLAVDTQFVKKGDVLVRLDATDAKLALATAQAQLAATERRVRALMANDQGNKALITARQADKAQAAAGLASAKSAFEKARIDLQRRETLAKSGSVSGEELTTARNAMQVAIANLRAAEAAQALAVANVSSASSQHDAAHALIDGFSVDTHPDVLVAKAARDQAQVNLDRMELRAPVDGVIARRQVQIGQKVQPGQPVMVVVPIQEAFVDANFKEVQLAKVKPGQPVTLYSDLYGSDVKYKGTVVGFSGGTGAAFAALPAQNATGNWIKVVQRVPVRIQLDKAELAKNPLRVGLSMHVDIDVSE